MKIPFNPKNKHEQQILAYFRGQKSYFDDTTKDNHGYKVGNSNYHHFMKGRSHAAHNVFQDPYTNKYYWKDDVKCAFLYSTGRKEMDIRNYIFSNHFEIDTEPRKD